jgi:hypothetical protein
VLSELRENVCILSSCPKTRNSCIFTIWDP